MTELLSALGQEISTCLQWTLRIVDVEESKRSARVMVASGVDEELDEIRRLYNGLDDFLVLPLMTSRTPSSHLCALIDACG